MADDGAREDGARRVRANRRDGGDLAGASYVAHQAFSQQNAAAQSVAARAGFGLNLKFFGGVIENGDADVIVGESVFDFGGDLGEHFFGIQRGDGVAGDVVDQRQLLRFLLLFGEEAGVFDGDGGFAGEHAQAIRRGLRRRRAPARCARPSRRSAWLYKIRGTAQIEPACRFGVETQARGFFGELLADQQRLGGADHVFGEMISRLAGSLGLALAVVDFDFKAQLARICDRRTR